MRTAILIVSTSASRCPNELPGLQEAVRAGDPELLLTPLVRT